MRRRGDVAVRQDREVVPFAIGDVVTLRKPHPCGGREWVIKRVGADLGLVCLKCGRRIMIDRFEVQRRMIRHESGQAESDAVSESSGGSFL